MVSHWSLTDSKSPQVSQTLHSILVDLYNVVIWMVFTRPLISNSSSAFIEILQIVPSAPTTIGITVKFMFYIYFSSSASSWYLPHFSLFVFTLCSAGRQIYFLYTTRSRNTNISGNTIKHNLRTSIN